MIEVRWRSRGLTAALLALLAIPALAQNAGEATLSIPAELQPAVATAEQTGRLLQRLDRAAWIATDEFVGDKQTRKLRKSTRGWITEAMDTGTRVSFFDANDPPNQVYTVDVESSGVIGNSAATRDTSFTDEQLSLIRARQAAMKQAFLACSPDYNSVVYRDGDSIRVYLMPGTKKQGIFPAGGHHLFVYDATGRTLQSQRDFTRSCIDLQGVPDKPMGDGFRPMGMMVTHLLDPQPTEIHVFISLNTDSPLYVGTTENRYLWKVSKGRISLVSDGKERDSGTDSK
jgi:hypothetical protein